jgi:hypothetical protein
MEQTGLAFYLLCLFAQTLLIAAIGGALVFFSRWQLVPFAVGVGIITYALVVAFYTLLSLWRFRRANA